MTRLLAVLAALACLCGSALAGDWMESIDKTNVILGRDGQGFCSGTIVSIPDRLILTAEHCVRDAYKDDTKRVVDPKTGEVHEVKIEKAAELEIWVQHYQNYEPVSAAHYTVKVVARDAQTDVALLQVIDTAYVPEAAAAFAPSTWTLKRGQTVYIVGNPGIVLDASVTQGIISNTQRTLDFGTGPQKFFQTDAAAIGGNSGGSVYNAQGQMIGTLTGGVNGSTMTFVAPIAFARALLVSSGFKAFDDAPAIVPASTGYAP